MFGVGAWLYIRARKNRPRFDKTEVVYEEGFASGYSNKNILTKLGGARSCLRLVVTRKYLIVTAWFPLSLFAAIYDLEHAMPLGSIGSARRARFLGMTWLVLTYRDANARERSLSLKPKNLDGFIRSLGVKIDDEEQRNQITNTKPH